MAALEKTDVVRGRLIQFIVNASSSPVLDLEGIKDGIVRVTEEIKKETYECVDGQELVTKHARKLTVELEFDELVQADITAISGGDELVLVTDAGSTNDTGVTITIADVDTVEAVIQDLKTKVFAELTTPAVSTLPYTIVANAA